ncbi:MAG: vWA domain-containing protein [Bacteroidia bacterium]
MKKNIGSKIIFSLLAAILLSTGMVMAQKKSPEQPTRILFLFDASQSMYARWETNTKYEVAKKMLSEMVDSLNDMTNLELALRVYGHTKKYPPQDCDDTRLEVPFGKNNSFAIKKRLEEINPSGTTPIARSLEECGGDFPKSQARNIIILITDGIEECNGDPCAVSAMLQKKGIVLKPFVIGLGLNKDFIKQFECIGNYFDATDETQFRNAFNIVITQALNNTTAQVNLLDIQSHPTETNTSITFYDQRSGAVLYNFMHTINAKGVPDTVQIDPLGMYRVTAHTIPSVSKDSVILTVGKHTIIALDAPQGDLQLKIDGANEYKKLYAIVRKHGEKATLNVQEFSDITRYIVGDYDLEVLTLPRIHINNVNVAQSKTTSVQIPTPGIATIICNAPGYGDILVEKDNKLEWVDRISLNSVKESIVLQPGLYRIVFRPKNSQSVIYTIEKTFRIASGISISVNIN